VVFRTALAIAALASCAAGADWTEYQSGPFRVISDSGDKAARDRLTELEQTRHVLGTMLGNGIISNDLKTVWPIVLVLFPTQKDYAPHALSQLFVPGGSANLCAWFAAAPLPLDLRHEIVRQLIESNAGRMGEPAETALGDLFSTLDVKATRVSLGAPLPAGALTGDRLRWWAKFQFLATQAEYAGKFRVYLNNIQQGGDETAAIRNAFDLSASELNRRVDAYLKRGVFEEVPASGESLNPNRDFVEKRLTQSTVSDLLAELAASGKSFPPASPRWLLAEGTRETLQQAAKANPRWGEPHFRLAALETNPLTKVVELKTAATLEPRNAGYWQALAEAQAAAGQHTDAAKSWASAEHAAADETERARIHQTRLDADQRRVDFELAEQARLAHEEAEALQRVKDAAAARLHAAEDAANLAQGGLKSTQTPVPFAELTTEGTVTGNLTRIDCVGGSMKLNVQPPSGASVVVLIRDSKAFLGANKAALVCGAQRPVRKVRVVHDAKPDAKMGTAGEIRNIEFP